MNNFFKSKLSSSILVLIRTSPFCVSMSMLFKALFLLTQLASISMIFGWAISGHVNPYVAHLVVAPSESVIYPCIGAFGFAASSLFSLLSKKYALRATEAFECHVINKYVPKENKLSLSDLNNIVKLMLSSLDSIVPIVLIFLVSTYWLYITPYSSIIVLTILCVIVWLMRKGIGFSTKKYLPRKDKPSVSEYVKSEQHERFYNILLLPSYISFASTAIVSLILAIGIVSAKYYFEHSGEHTTKLLLYTGVSFLQMRSFVGIVLRTGAYNKSLNAVYSVLISHPNERE